MSKFKMAASKAKKKFGANPFGEDDGDFKGKKFGKKKKKKGGFKGASAKAFGKPNPFEDDFEDMPFKKRG